MTTTNRKLYIFTTDGTRSAGFFDTPFLPLHITPATKVYENIQLQAILDPDNVNMCPYYNAVHKEQLVNAAGIKNSNTEHSLSFDVPTTHTDSQYVTVGSLVGMFDLDNDFQLFEVLVADEHHEEMPFKQVYAQHFLMTDLIEEWLVTAALSNVTAAGALTSVLYNTKWQPGTVDSLGSNSLTLNRTNKLNAVMSLVNNWNGELKPRITVSGSNVTGFYIDWLSQRGSVTGKRFRYGKDTTNVRRTTDTTNIKTALYGYGKQDTSGNMTTFASVTWSKANGDPADKPLGQEWIGDPTALANYGRDGGSKHRFDAVTRSNITDPNTLIQDTWNALQQINTPLVSYEMTVIDLEQVSGLAYEAIRLGDTVTVIDETFQPVLRVQARILEMSRDILDPLNTKVVLGNFLLTDTVDSQAVHQLQQNVNDLQSGGLQVGSTILTSWLQGAIDVLKNQIQSSGAYAYLTNADGLIVYDKPVDQNPTKAIKIGGGILGIANSKDANGNWNWSTFGTGDGFTANHITSGTFRGVSVVLGGSNNGNGSLNIYDNSGTLLLTLDKTGITLSNGATMLGGSGVLSTLVFTSSGDVNGWQKVGWWDNGGTQYNEEAYLEAYIPPNFTVTAATLYAKVMPVYFTTAGNTTGWTTASQLGLQLGTDAGGHYNYPAASEPSMSRTSMTDVTTAEWGGTWSPNSGTQTIEIKSADVQSELAAGHRYTYGVVSQASANSGYGLCQMELIVTGYKNG